MNRLPTPDGIAGGAQLPSTQTELIIAAGLDPKDGLKDDVGWLAHFYLRPNPFFFPNPSDMALVGPVPIKLKKRLKSTYFGLSVLVCPDPDDRFALIVVEGPPGTGGDPFDVAYEAAQAVLREVSFAGDVPLPIAHSMIVGVPSGVIRLQLPQSAPEVDFADLNVRLTEPANVELEEAKSLYWEGVSSPNVFHQFLTFWRIYERIVSARGAWRRANKRADVKITPERMPPMWAWSSYSDMSFDRVRQELEGPYRDAIAHADAKHTVPRTPLRAVDVHRVADQISIVRYMARTLIKNFEATVSRNVEPPAIRQHL
jgi:hypothetical protein